MKHGIQSIQWVLDRSGLGWNGIERDLDVGLKNAVELGLDRKQAHLDHEWNEHEFNAMTIT
jgi:hypothetical protein